MPNRKNTVSNAGITYGVHNPANRGNLLCFRRAVVIWVARPSDSVRRAERRCGACRGRRQAPRYLYAVNMRPATVGKEIHEFNVGLPHHRISDWVPSVPSRTGYRLCPLCENGSPPPAEIPFRHSAVVRVPSRRSRVRVPSRRHCSGSVQLGPLFRMKVSGPNVVPGVPIQSHIRVPSHLNSSRKSGRSGKCPDRTFLTSPFGLTVQSRPIPLWERRGQRAY